MRLSFKKNISWLVLVVCLSCQIRESEMTHSPVKVQLLSNDEPLLLADVTDGDDDSNVKINLTWYPRRPGRVTIRRAELGSSHIAPHVVVRDADATLGSFTELFPMPPTSVLNEEKPIEKKNLAYRFDFTDAETQQALQFDAIIEMPRNCLVTKAGPFTLPSGKYWKCRNLKLEAGAHLVVTRNGNAVAFESLETIGGKATLDLSQIETYTLTVSRAKGELEIVPPANRPSNVGIEVFHSADFILSGLDQLENGRMQNPLKAERVQGDEPTTGSYFLRRGKDTIQSCRKGYLPLHAGDVYRVEFPANEYLFASYTGKLIRVKHEKNLWKALYNLSSEDMVTCEITSNGISLTAYGGSRTDASLVPPGELPADAPFAPVSAMFDRLADFESVFRQRGIYSAPGFEKLVATKVQNQLLDQLVKHRAEVVHILRLRQIHSIQIGGSISEAAPYYSRNTLIIPPFIVRERSGPFMELLRE